MSLIFCSESSNLIIDTSIGEGLMRVFGRFAFRMACLLGRISNISKRIFRPVYVKGVIDYGRIFMALSSVDELNGWV